MGGTVDVTITATDVDGNTAECGFLVEIKDRELPWELKPCPVTTSGRTIPNGKQCGGKVVPVTTRSSDGRLTLGKPEDATWESCCSSEGCIKVSSAYSVCGKQGTDVANLRDHRVGTSCRDKAYCGKVLLVNIKTHSTAAASKIYCGIASFKKNCPKTCG